MKIGIGAISYALVLSKTGNHAIAIGVFLLETVFYQNVVVMLAMLLRLIAPNVFSYGKLRKMDPMDASTYLDSKECHVNYVNCSLQDIECAEAAFFKF